MTAGITERIMISIIASEKCFSQKGCSRSKNRRSKKQDPDTASNHIIHQKLRVIHTHYSGHKGREGAHYGQETGQDNSLAAVFLIEMVGAVKVFLLEKRYMFGLSQDACRNIFLSRN